MSKLFAYITLFLVLLLCLNGNIKNPTVSKYLKKYHGFLVFLVLVLSLIHGILAGKAAGMMSGKISWMVLLISSIVLLVMRKSPNKMKVHYILSTIFLVLCLSHIIFLW